MASELQPGGPGRVRLTGTYYAATSSRALEAVAWLGTGDTLHVDAPGVSRVESVSACALSEPVGRMPRHFVLPDGARLEIDDLEALGAWERTRGRTSGLHVVHALESRWKWVALAALLLLSFMLAGYFWGLPIAAKQLAARLPPEVGRAATEQARKIFPRLLRFRDSELPPERRAEVERRFQELATAMNGGAYDYRLEFVEASVANAFALPDGLIYITDPLIEEAQDEKEIYGILAHEIVHVREQHGLRSVLQNSAVFLIWTLMTGDLSAVSGLGASLPTVLAENGYSRRFEHEADHGAAEYLIRVGWGTKPLRDALRRMDPAGPGLGGAGEAISSHPLTNKRVRSLEEFESAGQERAEPGPPPRKTP